ERLVQAIAQPRQHQPTGLRLVGGGQVGRPAFQLAQRRGQQRWPPPHRLEQVGRALVDPVAAHLLAASMEVDLREVGPQPGRLVQVRQAAVVPALHQQRPPTAQQGQGVGGILLQRLLVARQGAVHVAALPEHVAAPPVRLAEVRVEGGGTGVLLGGTAGPAPRPPPPPPRPAPPPPARAPPAPPPPPPAP